MLSPPTAIKYGSLASLLAALAFVATSNQSSNDHELRGRRQLMFDPKTTMFKNNFPCPFTPPGRGEEHGIADWGGWEYDLPSIAAHHIQESAHKAVYDFMKKNGATSLVDVGAGVGQMKVALDKIGATDIEYVGFDGGSNIMELEGQNTPVYGDPNHVVPHLCWTDASKPFNVGRTFDAVLSKEVGEHIPPEGEANFMDNLVRLAKPGGGIIMLTWAHPGQGGFHHVNCKDQNYVIAKMVERGVIYSKELTESLIASRMPSAYAENLMVFVKP